MRGGEGNDHTGESSGILPSLQANNQLGKESSYFDRERAQLSEMQANKCYRAPLCSLIGYFAEAGAATVRDGEPFTSLCSSWGSSRAPELRAVGAPLALFLLHPRFRSGAVYKAPRPGLPGSRLIVWEKAGFPMNTSV